MSQTITKVKSRIRSVTGAYKVTSAMKLVSTVKLRTWKSKMIANKRYKDEVNNASDQVFKYLTDADSVLTIGNKLATKNLYIVVSSSLGLCGAYNTNIFKMADASIKKEDDAIILGKKGLIHFSNGEFNHIEEFSSYESIKNTSIISRLSEYLIETYKKGDYKEIHLIYTEYRNPIVFTSKDLVLLPFRSDSKESSVGYGPLLEPSKDSLINSLVPFVISNTLYSCLLESEVCEQASRSNAMENATANAEELLNDLKIEFNKARQNAITQEIIEIAAAANAL